MQQAIICDIDGCLFDTAWIFEETDRFGLVGKDKWEFFHRHVNDEKSCTCEKMKIFLTEIVSKNVPIFFITARSEEIRNETEQRIYKELPELNGRWVLLMRPLNNYYSSDILKSELLQEAIRVYGFDMALVIDDDPKNCAMFESFGIPTLNWRLLNNCTNEKERR